MKSTSAQNFDKNLKQFRFVDFYILSSQNFTGNSNATYHHSRLMGVSDAENAVSITQTDLNIQFLIIKLSRGEICVANLKAPLL